MENIEQDETLWEGYIEWLEEQAERDQYERSLWF